MVFSAAPSGWLILNKPVGISSTFAGAKIKRIFHQKKVGHAGTLDPFASGILPLALGEATKTMPFIMNRKKIYEFVLSFGTQTSTDDTEGETIATSARIPANAAIQAMIPRFIGEITQTPPAYSAIKINGKPAYKRRRKGEAVTVPERKVLIHDLRLIDFMGDSARFSVTCGTGTYVRALGRDLALALGSVGHLTALTRTAVGSFSLKDSISLEKLSEMGDTRANAALLPIGAVLDDIPAVTVSDREADDVRHGRAIAVSSPDRPVLGLRNEKLGLVALGHAVNGAFHPDRVFN